MPQRARIDQAISELKERRDLGERVHVILSEVACDHSVSLALLTARAEAEWGVPLETDHERHQEYFRLVEGAGVVAARASAWADFLFQEKARVPDYGWRDVTWEDHLEAGFRNWNLGNPELESIARDAFLERAEYYRHRI